MEIVGIGILVFVFLLPLSWRLLRLLIRLPFLPWIRQIELEEKLHEASRARIAALSKGARAVNQLEWMTQHPSTASDIYETWTRAGRDHP
jgi:hypothetical protein